MSDFQYICYLEQHSPLIHFQHDQPGATLRASELRPRLDQYLVAQKGGWAHIPKEWLVGRGDASHPALDYRVSITPLGKQQKEDPKQEMKGGKWNAQYPGYFANMGREKKEDIIELISYPQIKLTITCLHDGLLKFIKATFPAFLARSTFGTRKSKGFGSFWFHDQYIEDTLPKGTPYLYVQQKDFRKVAEVIDYYYKRLKSGINYSWDHKKEKCHGGRYQKAFLFQYLEKHKSYTWEKRWMKEKFLGLGAKSATPHFARAFLGLPGSITFRKTEEPCNSDAGSKLHVSHTKDIEITHEATVAARRDGREIQRAPSPLTFKPVRCGSDAYKVFILVNRYPGLDHLADTSFQFKAGGTIHALKTPPSLIDYDDLLEKYHQELGNTFYALFPGGRTESVSIHKL